MMPLCSDGTRKSTYATTDPIKTKGMTSDGIISAFIEFRPVYRVMTERSLDDPGWNFVVCRGGRTGVVAPERRTTAVLSTSPVTAPAQKLVKRPIAEYSGHWKEEFNCFCA